MSQGYIFIIMIQSNIVILFTHKKNLDCLYLLLVSYLQDIVRKRKTSTAYSRL